MAERVFEFFLGVLSVWRLTHLLSQEDGPGNVFRRIRLAAGTGFWGSLVNCFYCLSLWTSAPVALFITEEWTRRALTWLALSGAAILLERVTDRDADASPAFYLEHPGTPVAAEEDRAAGTLR
jgi:uncharacterized protein DUF1360